MHAQPVSFEKFINSDMVKMTKLVKLLTNCNRMQELMFMRLIKKYEIKKIVCTKYFYDINLKFNKSGEKYILNSVDISFIHKAALEHMNTQLSIPVGRPDIAAKLNLYEPFYSSFNVIIHMYVNSGYKYLFFPVIVDYSVDTGLVHQCALLIDLQQGIFLFYEPYGIYKKYDAEYISPIREFLELYRFPDKFYQPNLKLFTWHEYFGLATGVQSILLRAHNSKHQEFKQDCNTLFTQVLNKNPTKHSELTSAVNRNAKLPVNNDDYTYATLDILDYYNRNPDVDEHQCNYALYIYYKYNSKTCVTLTLTELDYFFNNLADLSYDEQKKNMQNYYVEYEKHLNSKLLTRVAEFCSPALVHILNQPLWNICSVL